MSDQTEVKQEYPTQLFVTIAGNHPMAEAAVAAVLSAFFNERNIPGRRQDDSSFDANFAVQTVNDIAKNPQSTVNIMVSQLTLNALQGQYQVWDWPNWGDASQPWTALVNDSLRNLWPTFTTQQKRAIYESFNELNIQVEGEDEPLTLESALRIVNSDDSETFVRFNANQDRTAFSNVTVDGKFVDQADLHAILFVLSNAVPGETDEDAPRLAEQPAVVEPTGLETPELSAGENPAHNGAHPAPELPDGREVPDVPEAPEHPAGPEHHPEDVNLVDGVPSVKSEDPTLAVNVPKSEPMSTGIGERHDDVVSFDAAQSGLSYATPPASGTVRPYHHNALED